MTSSPPAAASGAADDPAPAEIAEQLLIEAEDRLQALETAIMQLDIAPQDPEKAAALLWITRGFVKAAELADLPDLAEIAAGMDLLVEDVVLQIGLFEPASCAGLLDALDGLRAGFSDLASGKRGRVHARERILARLGECRAAGVTAFGAAQFDDFTEDDACATDRPSDGWIAITRPPTTHPAESLELARVREADLSSLHDSPSPEAR